MGLLGAVNCFLAFLFLLCRQKKNKKNVSRTFNLLKKMLSCRRSSDTCGWPWEGALGSMGRSCCDILREPRDGRG